MLNLDISIALRLGMVVTVRGGTDLVLMEKIVLSRFLLEQQSAMPKQMKLFMIFQLLKEMKILFS